MIAETRTRSNAGMVVVFECSSDGLQKYEGVGARTLKMAVVLGQEIANVRSYGIL